VNLFDLKSIAAWIGLWLTHMCITEHLNWTIKRPYIIQRGLCDFLSCGDESGCLFESSALMVIHHKDLCSTLDNCRPIDAVILDAFISGQYYPALRSTNRYPFIIGGIVHKMCPMQFDWHPQ
jgi:hypothetical protein